jgi:hypothetical protein
LQAHLKPHKIELPNTSKVLKELANPKKIPRKKIKRLILHLKIYANLRPLAYC